MSLALSNNASSVSQVETIVQTPHDLLINKIAFEIPSYQRPYVWGGEGVLKLLQDIEQAYIADEHQYYIGTVLSSQLPKKANKDASVSFELIDGQQRMTTLMLIAIAFKKANVDCELSNVATLAHFPRVTFSIREMVQGLLCSWTDLEFTHKPSDEDIHKNEYTKHLAEALNTATSFIKEIRKDSKKGEAHLVNFAKYFYQQVRWVNNIIPAGTDLNKLFATMNTSGVQLEQSDILKSKLLGKLSKNRHEYDGLWQVCENLNNYFERNVRRVFTASNWKKIQDIDLASFDKTKFKLVDTNMLQDLSDKGSESVRGLTLEEIISDESLLEKPESKQSSSSSAEDDEVFCRSIIGFPLFLIHAFRIYRAQAGNEDIESRVNGERLNQAFEKFVLKASELEVIKFLDCLWQVRYQFDKWVVKWVEKAEESTAVLRLSNVNFSKTQSRLNRVPTEITELSQLQSVRYFTGERSAQYWLTSFLGWLVENNTEDKNIVLAKLEDIDNKMSLALFHAELSQKQASFNYLTKTDGSFGSSNEMNDYLKQINGTGFEHYWFQKLEYVLWKNEQNRADEKFKKYRISSKNSVEHVHPQHEEYDKRLEDNYLNAFGNLVLLSPGENSSYSNQTVGKKQEDFKAKPVYDSLKLKQIFELKQNDEWDKDKIKQHQKEMICLLEQHYSGREAFNGI
ncbi:DUF262 domain-containing protein [Pseudoalteromonas sp. SCSIO 43088]|uniref:DUF262 domain-containing protein n=1 Tax=Pseudoalteromonas sp. SCSIO 43088 TaxID=2822846 RepID=UPI00202BA393|nr:DUF262 domain-containing protein [Pseudoalteromonas sp. SCSIO 43088]URQ87243.1 DUF262 domain-containing protein [Pseudoalteromonas sp. SCSIO 43088]